MKKIKMFLLALLVNIGTAMAADKIAVEAVSIPQGSQGTVIVNYQFDVVEQYSGWQFSLCLPEGLVTVKNEQGNPTFSTGDGYDSSYTFSASHNSESDDFVALSLQSVPMKNATGILISIPVVTTTEIPVGKTFTATIKGMQFGNKDGIHTTTVDDVSFSIIISEPETTRIVLEETAVAMPATASGVNVQVNRTIKANEWSTIVLPFSMTESQVKSAFGNDVQLADFSSWSSDEDDDGNIIGISVGFTSNVAEIEANHPYLIKVTTAVSEFTADGVDVEAEEEPTVQVGKKKAERGYMIGTYVANTLVPENDLFVSGNKYWYSKGQTKMKAFRAYFEFADVLTSVEEAGVRIGMFFENEETGIFNVRDIQSDGGSETYDLQGRKVQKGMKPGLYVKGGKKLVVK